MEIRADNGLFVQAEFLAERILRVRFSSAPEESLSLMERFGLLKQIWEPVETRSSATDDSHVLSGPQFTCTIEKRDASLTISDRDGLPVLGRCTPHLGGAKKAAGASLAINAEERFFGLGYRQTDFLQLRGKAFRNHVTYGAAYGPQPFLYSTAGYGLYFNETRDTFFDVGKSDSDSLRFWCEGGRADFFFFLGSPAEILALYTQVTGRPYLMPEKAYGLMFIANEKETQFDILRNAERLRTEKIPCGYIGLEPGWMETHYDASTDKTWNRDRFYMPWWSDDRLQFQDTTFIGALRRQGLDLSLWLCCDYDIFWKEEADQGEETAPEEDFFVFGEPDFDARAHTPIFMDKLTDPKTPWFEHLKRFIDDGVRAFKQDPAFVVNDHPDRLYAGRYTDREVHNVISSVLAKQVHQGYRAYTGLRPMHYTGSGYTGIQRWAPSWTCDCGGREEALMGVLHNSLCGHMNITCDLDVTTLEGLHFGFLLPWSQINSWAEVLHPWLLAHDEAFRFYAALHDSLIPYLYANAFVGHCTGMPILRALPLAYPHDPETDKATREYLLGDSLLVGCFSHRLYLPKGRWIDFWTGETLQGGRWIDAVWPETRGGSLFVKGGGILARKSEEDGMDYDIHIYGGGNGSFSLYEDDGTTFAYEEGQYSLLDIESRDEDGDITITLSPRRGTYEGRKGVLCCRILVHGAVGSSVTVNGETIPIHMEEGLYLTRLDCR